MSSTLETLAEQDSYEGHNWGFWSNRFALLHNRYATNADGKLIQKVPLDETFKYLHNFEWDSKTADFNLSSSDYNNTYRVGSDITVSFDTAVFSNGFKVFFLLDQSSIYRTLTLAPTETTTDIFKGSKVFNQPGILCIFAQDSQYVRTQFIPLDINWDVVTEAEFDLTTFATQFFTKQIPTLTQNVTISATTGSAIPNGAVFEFLNPDTTAFTIGFNANGTTLTFNRSNQVVSPGERCKVTKTADNKFLVEIIGASSASEKGVDFNKQTGTSYNLVNTDKAKTVSMDNASSNTINIQLNATHSYDDGFEVITFQRGAGVTTIQAPSGCDLNGVDNGSMVFDNQYDFIYLMRFASDDWVAKGGS